MFWPLNFYVDNCPQGSIVSVAWTFMDHRLELFLCFAQRLIRTLSANNNSCLAILNSPIW